jgi:diguanylate cyclase (GGDEF)-like protein/PAS domain S-box-containing protein
MADSSVAGELGLQESGRRQEVLLTSSELQVRQFLQTQVLECGPDTPLYEAAALMRRNNCSSIVIVEGQQTVGIWTERDALTVDFSRPESFQRPVRELMSAPVSAIPPDMDLQTVAAHFASDGVRHYLVVGEDGERLGVVSQTDVVHNQGLEHYLRLVSVDSVVSTGPVLVGEEVTLGEAARRMRESRRDAVAVTYADGGLGSLTERDLVRFVAERITGTPVGEVASRPLLTVPSDYSLLQVRRELQDRGIRHIGVVDDDGALMGLVGLQDLLSGMELSYLQELQEVFRERDQALVESRRNLNLAEKVIEHSLEGVMITDRQGNIQSVNPAFTHITGYHAEEVIGRKPSVLSSGFHGADFYQAMWQSIQDHGYWQGEIWNRRKDGEAYPQLLTITAIRDGDGAVSHFAGLFSDISKLKESEDEIKSLAYYDPLTGLPNRRLLEDRLHMVIQHARRHKQRAAVMFLDLDLFKGINDTLGHDVGDWILKEMARRLEGCLRESDTVARLGGDEFTVLAEEVEGEEEAARLARRLVDAMREPFRVDDRELDLTTSVGISLFPEDGEEPEELIKAADQAMYRAKNLGRNSYQFANPSGAANSLENVALETQLRQAVEGDQLRLNYHVKVDLTDGHITGVEALVHWDHPDLGLVSPAHFLPVAEQAGLMDDLSDWVLRRACAQNRYWQDQGLALTRMGVNLSGDQLTRPGLAQRVGAILDETGLEPRWLELELTEKALLENQELAQQELGELRDKGVFILVDDYGTGYSSLPLLHRMPVDGLKMDISLIQDMPGSSGESDVVSAMIAMAHHLKLRIVAEGVETNDQLYYLRHWGCDEIQGFLLSRPLSAQNFTNLFSRELLPDY